MPTGKSAAGFEPMRARGASALAVAVLAATVLALPGCGQGLVCPAGTVKYGNTCKAADDSGPQDDVVLPEILPPDEGPGDVPAEVADLPGETTPGDALPDPVHVDTPPAEIVYPGGVIGKKCQLSTDCRNEEITKGSCLAWSKGYCTLKDCGAGGSATCPSGSVCMGIALDQPACAQTCESDADCRVGDGYACKLLPDPSGALVRICHQVKTPGLPGDGCSTPADCAGPAGCLATFTGGYCAVLACGADTPCADGTRCVLLGGAPLCLKGCATDADCQVGADVPRGCIDRRDAVSGDKVKVCGSSVKGGPIGAQCLNETECDSGRCDIAATGLCSASQRPCKVDLDCGSTEVCAQDSSKTYGYCTAECSSSKPCPAGQSLCVETLVPGTTVGKGLCTPGCTAETECRTEAGLDCRYGDPLLSPGRYACAALALREIGTICSSDADCRLGNCLGGSASSTGYCSAKCADLYLGRCPFPTACQTADNVYKCLVRCLSDADCIGDTRCDTNAAPLPVCIPKA